MAPINGSLVLAMLMIMSANMIMRANLLDTATFIAA